MRSRAVTFRPARPDEGPELTELSLRAKAHWGYDETFLHSARANLTIEAGTIRSAQIEVAEREGTRIGFYGLVGEPPEGRLEWMFLEPDSIGGGYGRLMWKQALRRAEALGFTRLVIESDRFAEPFYLEMGARRIGGTPSPVDGATLPLLEIVV
jgi:GNAT superfamily N-acetyltransferase